MLEVGVRTNGQIANWGVERKKFSRLAIARHDLPYTTPLIFTLHTLIGTRSDRTWFFSPVWSDFFGVRCKKTQSVVIHFSLNMFRSFQSDLVWSGLVWYGPVSSVCIQQCTPKRLDRIRPDQTVILVKILLIVMDWKKLATHTNQIFSPITSLQWALSFRRRLGNCRPWCNCPLVNAKGFVLVQPPGECVSN